MTMVSREPRQIVSFDVQLDKDACRLQGVVDDAEAEAKNYATDGNVTYLDLIFPGEHIRNIRNKKDTHIVESINADLRHFISGLRRRSRCFYRNLATLQAVLSAFINAYNKFGEAKLKHCVPVKRESDNPKKHLHIYREVPFSVLDYL